jgi:DNA-directed RNA polymerase subunit RPC12/RpoP
MYYTCKACGTRVKIPEEWLLLGLNKRYTCTTCGKQVNLVLSKFKKTDTITTDQSKPGTVIMNGDAPTLPSSTFRISIAKETTGETLAIKEIANNNTYIIGRSTKTVKEYDPRALPIIIPTEFDGAVSRVHVLMRLTSKGGNGQVIIQDLKSRNKTILVTGESEQELDPRDQVFVEPGDKIKIGLHTVITLVSN